VFSGAASAFCAPVLAGVVVVAGAAASFRSALAIGVANVIGLGGSHAVLPDSDWSGW
jgi:cytochrome c-type biogenesis protein